MHATLMREIKRNPLIPGLDSRRTGGSRTRLRRHNARTRPGLRSSAANIPLRAEIRLPPRMRAAHTLRNCEPQRSRRLLRPGRAGAHPPPRPRRPGRAAGIGARQPGLPPAVGLSARPRRPVRRARGPLASRGLLLARGLRGPRRRDRRGLQRLPDRARAVPVRVPRLLRPRAPRRPRVHAGGAAAGGRVRVRPPGAAPHRGQHPARQPRLYRARARRGIPPGGVLAALPADRRPLA